MYLFPEQSRVDKVVHKNKIYERARPPKTVRELFVAEVGQIVWKHKLSSETLRLPPANGIEEVQVFEIAIRCRKLSPRVLQTLDRAIPYPVFFRLCRPDRATQWIAAYKRPAESGSHAWVLGDYYSTAWTDSPEPSAPLPVALDVAGVYEQMLLPLIGLAPRVGERLPGLVAREIQIRQLRRQVDALTAKMKSEKLFNRKVNVHADRRQREAELSALLISDEDMPRNQAQR